MKYKHEMLLEKMEDRQKDLSAISEISDEEVEERKIE